MILSIPFLQFIFFVGLCSGDAEINAKNAVLQLISADNALAPKFLRLAFHDCVSDKCDGCINKDLPDNKGLEGPIQKLEDVYKPGGQDSAHSQAMSRADFWIAASVAAVEWGVQQAGEEPLPEGGIQWTLGRKDCATSPFTASTTADIFPKADMTSAQIYGYFASRFGLSKRETVALMGAHTFGGAVPVNSGFDWKWTLAEWKMFNNHYHHVLVEPTYGWVQEKNAHNRYEWRCIDDENPDKRDPCGMMLNCDVALVADLVNLAADGKDNAGCTFKGSTFTNCNRVEDDVYNYVQQINTNNGFFLAEFAKVYAKVIARK